ncbi:hypothetical protein [Novosphingobium sp.]|uniref:hypothetical protein n=1 Tax=Novosphingobium sp. TaxID=1874826 RepID=UPI00333E3C4E
MRYLFAAAALMLSSTGQAAEPAASPAQAFAHAWLDRDSTTAFSRLALHDKLQRCVNRGLVEQSRIDAARPKLELYLNTFFDGFDRVEGRVADKAQTVLSANDLRSLAKAFSSAPFRRMRKEALANMSQTIVPAVPGCGDQGKPVAVSQLGANVLAGLRPAEIAQFRALAMSPPLQHFGHVMPQLMAVMMDAYRDDVAHAMQVIGASPAAEQAMRAMPSPIVMDAPPPAPNP